jgi:hypothetical protein
MPMSAEQHLVRLQQIVSDQKGTAVRQLDVGDLQLRAPPPRTAKSSPSRTGTPRLGGTTAAQRCRALSSADGRSAANYRATRRKIRQTENHQIGMHCFSAPLLSARLAVVSVFTNWSGASVMNDRAYFAAWRRRELRLDRAPAFKYL